MTAQQGCEDGPLLGGSARKCKPHLRAARGTDAGVSVEAHEPFGLGQDGLSDGGRAFGAVLQHAIDFGRVG